MQDFSIAETFRNTKNLPHDFFSTERLKVFTSFCDTPSMAYKVFAPDGWASPNKVFTAFCSVRFIVVGLG